MMAATRGPASSLPRWIQFPCSSPCPQPFCYRHLIRSSDSRRPCDRKRDSRCRNPTRCNNDSIGLNRRTRAPTQPHQNGPTQHEFRDILYNPCRHLNLSKLCQRPRSFHAIQQSGIWPGKSWVGPPRSLSSRTKGANAGNLPKTKIPKLIDINLWQQSPLTESPLIR